MTRRSMDPYTASPAVAPPPPRSLLSGLAPGPQVVCTLAAGGARRGAGSLARWRGPVVGAGLASSEPLSAPSVRTICAVGPRSPFGLWSACPARPGPAHFGSSADPRLFRAFSPPACAPPLRLPPAIACASSASPVASPWTAFALSSESLSAGSGTGARAGLASSEPLSGFPVQRDSRRGAPEPLCATAASALSRLSSHPVRFPPPAVTGCSPPHPGLWAHVHATNRARFRLAYGQTRKPSRCWAAVRPWAARIVGRCE